MVNINFLRKTISARYIIICFSHIKRPYLWAMYESEHKTSVFLTRKSLMVGEFLRVHTCLIFFTNLFFFAEVHRSTPCVQSSRFIPKITNGAPVKGICWVEPWRFTSSNSMACPSISISKTCYRNWYYNLSHYPFFLFLGRVRVRSVKKPIF